MEQCNNFFGAPFLRNILVGPLLAAAEEALIGVFDTFSDRIDPLHHLHKLRIEGVDGLRGWF